MSELFPMREATFTTEIKNSLEELGHFAYKLGDAPITRAVLEVTRFTPGKPFDLVAGIQGKLVGIETKQIKKWRSFTLRDMRPAQLEGLDKLVATGNRAFVFLNIRIEPDFTKDQKRENRLVIFDWAWLREQFEFGRINIAELRSLPFVQGKKKRFDLSAFVAAL